MKITSNPRDEILAELEIEYGIAIGDNFDIDLCDCGQEPCVEWFKAEVKNHLLCQPILKPSQGKK